jgi:hypothetical protein
MMVFEAALAAGARLGDVAWGGAHAHLTTAPRFGSAVSVLFYAARSPSCAGARPGARNVAIAGVRGLAVIFALATLMNLASESQWENYWMAPSVLVLGHSA